MEVSSRLQHYKATGGTVSVNTKTGVEQGLL